MNMVRQKIYIHWNAIKQTYKSANRKIHGPAKVRSAALTPTPMNMQDHQLFIKLINLTIIP